MRRLQLTRWFRRRMVPLVLSCSVIVAAAAPVAFYVQKRHELVLQARADAVRVADVLRSEIEQCPLLWRYNATKLAERLGAEGLGQLPSVVVHDAMGVAVPVDTSSAGGGAVPARGLWGRAEVMVYGQHAGTVWVMAGTAPLRVGTAKLAAAFLLLSILLSAVLYLLPMWAIAAAERRVVNLMGQLAQTLQEEDRQRIARDLHDGAGQAITAALLQLGALRRSTGDNPAVSHIVSRIAAHLDEALAEVRRSTYALAPPALLELGLSGALSRHCAAFAEATGLAVCCDGEALCHPISTHLMTACYRIVQEALTNIARHAGAKRAWVRVATTDTALVLWVSDDGGGLPEQATSAIADVQQARKATSGSGLRSIHERTSLLFGTVAVTRGAGGGDLPAGHATTCRRGT